MFKSTEWLFSDVNSDFFFFLSVCVQNKTKQCRREKKKKEREEEEEEEWKIEWNIFLNWLEVTGTVWNDVLLFLLVQALARAVIHNLWIESNRPGFRTEMSNWSVSNWSIQEFCSFVRQAFNHFTCFTVDLLFFFHCLLPFFHHHPHYLYLLVVVVVLVFFSDSKFETK